MDSDKLQDMQTIKFAKEIKPHLPLYVEGFNAVASVTNEVDDSWDYMLMSFDRESIIAQNLTRFWAEYICKLVNGANSEDK